MRRRSCVMTRTQPRRALVTGATRGIGQAIARDLVGHGLHVVLGGRDRRRGEEVARELGAGATFFALDVTDETSIASVASMLEAEGLDVLVNNAGIALDGFDADVARRTLDANF